MALLPPAVRRMWLRQFGKPTRRADWPVDRAAVQGARISRPMREQDMGELVLDAVGELVLVEAGALGDDLGAGDVITHDGVTLEIVNGPNPHTTDRAWEYYEVHS